MTAAMNTPIDRPTWEVEDGRPQRLMAVVLNGVAPALVIATMIISLLQLRWGVEIPVKGKLILLPWTTVIGFPLLVASIAVGSRTRVASSAICLAVVSVVTLGMTALAQFLMG